MAAQVKQQLDAWLMQQGIDRFPGAGRVNYPQQYKTLSEYLNRNLHPEVEKGAAVHANDPQATPGAPGDGIAASEHDSALFLNDHGPEHVTMVIRRASDLLSFNSPDAALTPYETYIFLVAAHLHDLGNVYGRTLHEQKGRQLLQSLGSRAGDDDLEKMVISQIAAAHCGRYDGHDPDTIGHLEDTHLLGEPVRIQSLAALLRLADELADDRSRASRFRNVPGVIPQQNEIYHQYSHSLHSVVIADKEIMLKYDMNFGIASREFPKKQQQVFLLDEIFERTLKMHRERMYCMRFLRPLSRVDAIHVTIEVFNDVYSARLERLPYRLQEIGYPAPSTGGVGALCPDLSIRSGLELKEKLTTNNRSAGNAQPNAPQ